MAPTVECCIRNVERAQRRALEDDLDVSLIEKPCLHRCGDCTRGRYAVVDGSFLAVDENRTLLEAVRESERR